MARHHANLLEGEALLRPGLHRSPPRRVCRQLEFLHVPKNLRVREEREFPVHPAPQGSRHLDELRDPSGSVAVRLRRSPPQRRNRRSPVVLHDTGHVRMSRRRQEHQEHQTRHRRAHQARDLLRVCRRGLVDFVVAGVLPCAIEQAPPIAVPLQLRQLRLQRVRVGHRARRLHRSPPRLEEHHRIAHLACIFHDPGAGLHGPSRHVLRSVRGVANLRAARQGYDLRHLVAALRGGGAPQGLRRLRPRVFQGPRVPLTKNPQLLLHLRGNPLELTDDVVLVEEGLAIFSALTTMIPLTGRACCRGVVVVGREGARSLFGLGGRGCAHGAPHTGVHGHACDLGGYDGLGARLLHPRRELTSCVRSAEHF
eukprot:PhM_4_TR2111/c1_g1_i1/m.57551